MSSWRFWHPVWQLSALVMSWVEFQLKGHHWVCLWAFSISMDQNPLPWLFCETKLNSTVTLELNINGDPWVETQLITGADSCRKKLVKKLEEKTNFKTNFFTGINVVWSNFWDKYGRFDNFFFIFYSFYVVWCHKKIPFFL